MLFHDTNVRYADFGVWRFWSEVTKSYPGFEFLHGYGLGVLAVGDEMPEPLRWLVRDRAAVPHETAEIREFFSRLGQFTSDEAALASRVHGMQCQLEDMLSSVSWRVTAPLRRFKQLLLRISPRA